MHADIERITQLAETISSARGLSIVDVRLAQQGKHRTLEVTIYRAGGRISLDDCEQVSKDLEAALDSEPTPLVDGSYMLEVQSPGIDRKLASEREYKLFSGQAVEVKTRQKVDDLGAAFTGKLVGLDNGNVIIEQPEKISDKKQPKNKKQQSTEAAPGTIAVQMSNVISVKLLPTMPPQSDGSTTE